MMWCDSSVWVDDAWSVAEGDYFSWEGHVPYKIGRQPIFWGVHFLKHNQGPLEPTIMFFFGLKVPNLQILKIGDLLTRHFPRLRHPNPPSCYNFGPLVSSTSTKLCSRTALEDLFWFSVTLSKKYLYRLTTMYQDYLFFWFIAIYQCLNIFHE